MVGDTGLTCEVCGSPDSCDIGITRKYMNEQTLSVCKDCGFVFVANRRPAAEIAADWNAGPGTETYAADLASVEARHSYVARRCEPYWGKSVVDIGSGDGMFLRLLKSRLNLKDALGVSPSWDDCQAMLKSDIRCYHGLGEDCDATGFDSACLLWTLENTGSCKAVMANARNMVKVGGHVIVATGSRILVPFKKPIDRYIGPAPADLHPWRFSKNTLRGLMVENGLTPVFTNRYLDSDHLVVVGRRDKHPDKKWPKDDYRDILTYFREWHWMSRKYA